MRVVGQETRFREVKKLAVQGVSLIRQGGQWQATSWASSYDWTSSWSPTGKWMSRRKQHHEQQAATQLKSTQPVTPSISPRKEMCINSKELLQFLCVKSWVDGMMTHMLLIVFVLFAEWYSTPKLQVFAPREILLPARRCSNYKIAQTTRYSS